MNPPKVLSLVIPVFNESDSLATLLAEISEVAKKLPETKFDVVFVDDGSRDESWPTIQALAAKFEGVRGVRFRRNFGKSAALNAGFKAARGDTVMTLDADLQDDPHEIPEFLAKLAEGFDLVSGYKQKRNDPIYKVFPSRVFNWMVSVVTGVNLHDHNCGFKAFRGAVVKELDLFGELHRFIPVLAATRGFRVGERVVNHRPRRFGSSKFGFSRYLKGFLDLLQVKFVTSYGWRPMHFFGTLAVLCVPAALFSLVIACVFAVSIDRVSLGAIAGLVATAVFALLGSQSLLVGFATEAAVRQRRDDPFSIAETTP